MMRFLVEETILVVFIAEEVWWLNLEIGVPRSSTQCHSNDLMLLGYDKITMVEDRLTVKICDIIVEMCPSLKGGCLHRIPRCHKSYVLCLELSVSVFPCFYVAISVFFMYGFCQKNPFDAHGFLNITAAPRMLTMFRRMLSFREYLESFR